MNNKFRKGFFRLSVTNGVQKEKYKFNLEISKSNQVTFGSKSLGVKDPKV